MEWINYLIGILAGILFVIPVFLLSKKWLKFVFAILAIVVTLGTTELSKHYLYPHMQYWRFERQITGVPLFSMIAKHHPKEFDAFMQQVKQGILQGQSESILASYSSQLMERVFYQHLETASDDIVMRYLGSMLELYRFLYTQDPKAVLRMEYGTSSTGNFSAIWEDKNFQTLLGQLLEVKMKVIETSIAAPVAVPTQAEAGPLLQALLEEMAQKFGEEVVQQMFHPKQNKLPASVIAPLIMDFYARMGTKGPEQAGIMMRYIASLRVKGMENAEKAQSK